MSSTLIVLMMALAVPAQTRGGLDDWKRVESPLGGFSVEVPGKAGVQLGRRKNENGLADAQLIIVEAGGVTYTAGVVEIRPAITPDKLDEFFDGVKRVHTQGKGRTLKREQRGGKLHGMPIFFVNMNVVGPDGKTRNEQTRFLLADPTHSITMQVTVPPGVEVNDEIRHFFNSLEYDPGRASRATPNQPAKPAAKPVAAHWRAFSPTGKGFSVQMPGETKFDHKDLPDGPVSIDSYEANLRDRVYTVAVYNIPPTVAAQAPGVTLENLGKAIVSGMKGTLVAMTPAPRDGLEGRGVTFDLANPDSGEPADGRILAYADGSKLFVLLYAGPKGSATNADLAKFLDSFRRTGKAKPTEPKNSGPARVR